LLLLGIKHIKQAGADTILAVPRAEGSSYREQMGNTIKRMLKVTIINFNNDILHLFFRQANFTLNKAINIHIVNSIY
jgi:hypothetical protein